MTERSSVSFWVPGVPVTQGSKTYFRTKGGKTVGVEANKRLKAWRSDVRTKAEESMVGAPWSGPVSVTVDFFFARPKGHYGTGRNADKLKDSAPALMATGQDVDKLSRAILDALSGVVFHDDRQVFTLSAGKYYDDIRPEPGAMIKVLHRG